MRPDLVENFSMHSSRGAYVYWIVVLIFLGLGLLVGWLYGYHAAKREFSGKTLVGDDDE